MKRATLQLGLHALQAVAMTIAENDDIMNEFAVQQLFR
jgi:hypothetical protein